MKCPKCDDEMMVLCRRDSSGFLNELYYRCLSCGSIPEEASHAPIERITYRQPRTLPRMKAGNWRWKTLTATMLASLVLLSLMQIPVPVRVFAAELNVDPVKDILPYVSLVNLTVSQFSLNYTAGQVTIHVTADFASITTTEATANVTTCVMILGKVLVNYQDSKRTLNMGFASLTMTIRIRFQDMMANIDASTYMPMWTAIVNQLTG